MPLARSFIALFATGGGAVLIAPIAMAVQASAAAAPNPTRGGQLFLQCRACHTVVPGGAHTVGPNLAGIVGTKAATRPGYKYSPALTKSGIVWNAASLDGFLKRPSQYVPGNKMAYAGVANTQSRADLIAYLTTLKGKK